MPKANEVDLARQVLKTESDAILKQLDCLDDNFVNIVSAISNLPGKVVITGIGKSGIIGSKIAGTLASTGTPALFLHPVEGVHGDMGLIEKEDLLIAISNSGATEEVLNLVFAVEQIGLTTLGICSNPESTLAELCDFNLIVAVDHEACPLGLAPTASTTAVLAVGDALAMALASKRELTSEDYSRFHPGGSLGRRLKLRVRDIMLTGDALPLISANENLGAAMQAMSSNQNLGVALAVDNDGCLAGIVTDGDLRRIFLKGHTQDSPITEVMTQNPKLAESEALASEALMIMEQMAITSLAIVDGQSRPIGLVHLHDILGRGKVIL
ncbi:MAG: KpsF/GutQ family sugar-phosphate isomerase [Planctomycetota bacterium]|nr:KpsF/GutQ family sugar-phosphate isomerase [Planctomycetota bacterium]